MEKTFLEKRQGKLISRFFDYWGYEPPERIEIVLYLISCILILLYASKIHLQFAWDSIANNTALLILWIAVTLHFFTKHIRTFLLLSVVEILSIFLLITQNNKSDLLSPILLQSVFIFRLALYIPTRASLLIGVMEILLIPFFGNFPKYYPLQIFLTPILIELVILVISLLFVYYREKLVEESEKVVAQQDTIKNLIAANDSLLRNLPEMKEVSAEKERLRITRELHDTLGYSMTNITMLMNATQYLLDSDRDKVREYCLKTKKLATTTMGDIRATLYNLRRIGENTPDDACHFFHKICQDFQEATGVPTECHLGNLCRHLPEPIFQTLLRTIQVGLINALKHGKTTMIRVFFWISRENLTLTVWNSRDSSKSVYGNRVVDMEDQGIGLRGVNERIEELEGFCQARFVLDGFELRISIPYKELYDVNNKSGDS